MFLWFYVSNLPENTKHTCFHIFSPFSAYFYPNYNVVGKCPLIILNSHFGHIHNYYVHTARLRIDEAHLLPAITENTPLEYLIPTTTGAGACTTALVDFLVLVHNDFIEGCRGIVTEQETRCFL